MKTPATTEVMTSVLNSAVFKEGNGAEQAPITFAEITSARQKCIAKQFSLNEDGSLKKSTSASVTAGHMRRVFVSSATEFAQVLTKLRPDQCLTYGVPPHDAKLVTKDEWDALGRPSDCLPRAKEVFAWPEGRGVLMLDYDAPKDGSPPLSREALVGITGIAVPGLLSHDCVWLPSTSSLIYTAEGREITGIKGQRLYVTVRDAADIPRAGKAINERLWAQGHGQYEVSKSGSLLERPVFDGSVWQANHIDFAAGAKCGPGLEQRRGSPLVIVGDALDTKATIPDLTASEQAHARANKDAAKRAVFALAERVRIEWIESRIDEIVKVNPRLDRSEARKIATRAVETADLTADWQITVRSNDGNVIQTFVREVLSDPEKFDGLLTLDPLEPDYDGGRWVGKLYLSGARPNLHSKAHGGATYRLSRQPQRIEVVKGKASETVDSLIGVMRGDPSLFDLGSELVVVDRGAVHPLNADSLRYEAGKIAQFWSWRAREGAPTESLIDPPSDVCRSVLAMGARRKLKPLIAVVTAPTLRPDGSVLALPGYDTQTQMLLEPKGAAVTVLESPSRAQADQALNVLWQPFKNFPFVTALDRSVHLAALLTAVIRPVLGTSPAFAYDAPVQGSGKSLLARCVGILAQGEDPSVWPHTAGRDDEEVRKRLFTALRSGARAIVWDNVTGVFDSAALAAALTSPSLSDRILGSSQSTTVPNRALTVLTGNNLTLAGDMARRVLVARIDPETDKPFARSFDLDPATFVLLHRQQLVAAALTLIRAQLMHGCVRPGPGAMASFEQWDKFVRQTIIFCGELAPGEFGDVMDAVELNQLADPEQQALADLLRALKGEFGVKTFQASDVVQRIGSVGAPRALQDAIEQFLPPQGRLTTKTVGRLLKYRMGRVCDGLRLVSVSATRDGRVWRVSEHV